MKPTLYRLCVCISLVAGAFAAALPARGANSFITLASTTSTYNSGLLDYLLPLFTQRTGIDVRVVAVGTGQALHLAQRGDADVLMVHDKNRELKFVAEGFGTERRDLMYNDFVIIGPESDPAEAAAAKSVTQALRKIADSETVFISRGDDSGTHRAELRLWDAAGINPIPPSGTWYLEVGAGMGTALNIASAKNAYILSDRATWTSFGNKGDLALLFEGDAALFNQYGVIPVNPARFPHIKNNQAQVFVDWLTSPEGQAAIASFAVSGEQLFFPNATGSNATGSNAAGKTP